MEEWSWVGGEEGRGWELTGASRCFWVQDDGRGNSFSTIYFLSVSSTYAMRSICRTFSNLEIIRDSMPGHCSLRVY